MQMLAAEKTNTTATTKSSNENKHSLQMSRYRIYNPKAAYF